MERQKKVRLIKKVWLTFFIVMILNNVIGETILAFAQSPPPSSNPFLQYLPDLVPLGYLITFVLFLLGLIAYRRDYGYAIVLISASALVAGLINYGVANAYGASGNVLNVTQAIVAIGVRYPNGSGIVYSVGSNYEVGYIQAPLGQEIEICIETWNIPTPPLQYFNVTWYVGNEQLKYSNLLQFHRVGNVYVACTALNTEEEGSNTIEVVLSYVKGNTLYYGYTYAEFRYVPETSGSFFEEMALALMAVSGIGIYALGWMEEFNIFNYSIASAINGLIYAPTLNTTVTNTSTGASTDAVKFYNYFQNIATTLGVILIALGIGINAMKGGYSDMIDLAMDFFYRSGIFALFTYSGLQIYNAIANSLNIISNYIISNVLNAVSSALAFWTTTALNFSIATNLTGFGFDQNLSNLTTLLIEIDLAIFGMAYVKVVLTYTLVSMIPLIVALWTFEWTRGIATALTDILVGLTFGGVFDSLILYFLVQVGGIAFFVFAPLAMLVIFAVSFGSHEIVKNVGSQLGGKAHQAYVQPVMSGISAIGSAVRTAVTAGAGAVAEAGAEVPMTDVISAGGGSQIPQGQNAPTISIPQTTPTRRANTPLIPTRKAQQLPTTQTSSIPQTTTQTSSISQTPTQVQPQSQTQPTQKVPPQGVTQQLQTPNGTITSSALPQGVNTSSVQLHTLQQAMQQLRQAIQQLGGNISMIRLNNGDKYASVKITQEGYLVTKGIRTSQGVVVEKSYMIPSFKSIEEVTAGLRKNFLEKGGAEIDPELVGRFFKSLESNTSQNENVRTTELR